MASIIRITLLFVSGLLYYICITLLVTYVWDE
nr:MAG TPA: hypothetical protein [Caudoviricetes sp.]